jgi:hypothetical protein
MNLYSKRWLAAVVLAGALVGACGGSSSDTGTATNKADWDKKNGPAVKAVSLDVDQANTALDKGDRVAILSVCNQLQSDLGDARKGLPVPDATADGALKPALDSVGTATDTCLQGAKNPNDAHLVEDAQRDMKAARTKLDDAQKALANWQ